MNERLSLINKTHKQLSIRKQCELLSLHRSVLYYQHQTDEADVWLMNLIRDQYGKCSKTFITRNRY